MTGINLDVGSAAFVPDPSKDYMKIPCSKRSHFHDVGLVFGSFTTTSGAEPLKGCMLINFSLQEPGDTKLLATQFCRITGVDTPSGVKDSHQDRISSILTGLCQRDADWPNDPAGCGSVVGVIHNDIIGWQALSSNDPRRAVRMACDRDGIWSVEETAPARESSTSYSFSDILWKLGITRAATQ